MQTPDELKTSHVPLRVCCLQQADLTFLADMATYMHNTGGANTYPHATMLHMLWWSWNPNSGDTGGIVEDDWATVSSSSVRGSSPFLCLGFGSLMLSGPWSPNSGDTGGTAEDDWATVSG
jgi:hypothetical protein